LPSNASSVNRIHATAAEAASGTLLTRGGGFNKCGGIKARRRDAAADELHPHETLRALFTRIINHSV